MEFGEKGNKTSLGRVDVLKFELHKGSAYNLLMPVKITQHLIISELDIVEPKF